MPPSLISVSLLTAAASLRAAWRAEVVADAALLLLDCCASVEEARAAFALRPPQVALIDMSEVTEGGAAFLREMASDSGCVVIAAGAVADALPALRAGAVGFLALNETTPGRWRDAIVSAHEGGAPLTPLAARRVVNSLAQEGAARDPELSRRERAVYEQLATGATYRAIGAALGISEDTVRAHIRGLYRKIRVNSRSEAISKFTLPLGT